MLIIAGMAGTDVIFGLGVFMLAIYRFILYANQDQNTLVFAWSCITVPPLVMTFMGLQLTSVMNVVVSSDRLMAVAWPLKYHKLNVRSVGRVLLRMNTTAAQISDYLLTSAFGGQGLVITVANGMLLLTILLQSSLRVRKEMLIIAGMAGTDVIYGLGVFILAIYRFILYANQDQNTLVSAWSCATIPPLIMTYIGTQLSSIMNVVVSFDRLLAVAWPAKYHKLGIRYAGKMLALVALFGLTSMSAMLLTTYFYTSPSRKFPKICAAGALSFAYSLYYTTLVVVAGYVSIAIYLCVFIAYRRASRQIASHTLANQRQAMARERRLTVTLGIIAISTLLLFIAPFSILAVCAWMNVVPPQSLLIGIITRFSTIVNVFIYVYRQKEMRHEMGALMRCKMGGNTATSVTALSTGRSFTARDR